MPCIRRRPRMRLSPVAAVPGPRLTRHAVDRPSRGNRGPEEDDLLARRVVHHGRGPQPRDGRGMLVGPVLPVPGPGVEVWNSTGGPAAVKEGAVMLLVVVHRRLAARLRRLQCWRRGLRRDTVATDR